MTDTFKALILEKHDKQVSHSIRDITVGELPSGGVLLKTAYSSLNYKDGLAVTNKGRIVFGYPIVPGVDAAGTVVESDSAEYQPGDEVILNGWETGERHWGGYADMLRTEASRLVSLPSGLSLKQAMMLGTAGYTAMLAVMALEDAGLTPESDREILVTGAAGGVGSISILILAQLGYRVIASTGRPELRDYLTGLGAADLIDRSELAQTSPKAFVSERWGGAIDNVGGDTLATLIKALDRGAAVAACGLAGGSHLNTTVFPFILRGVKLLGIDSNMCPKPRRQAAWNRLAETLPLDKLEALSETIPLEEVPAYSETILKGQVRGRVVVELAGG